MYYIQSSKYKQPGKTVISTQELEDVFNEHFINIGPNLAKTIQKENDGTFQDFINKQDPEFSYTTKYTIISLESNFYRNISLVLDPSILLLQHYWIVQMNGMLIWAVAFIT